MSQEVREVDINDAFDEIVFSEQRLSTEAFEEGYKKGTADGLKEGFHLGYHRGAELGLEVGFYRGVLSAISDDLQSSTLPPRIATVAQKLLLALDSIPDENKTDCDILQVVENARACFKQLMSLLKLPIVPPSTSSSSF